MHCRPAALRPDQHPTVLRPLGLGETLEVREGDPADGVLERQGVVAGGLERPVAVAEQQRDAGAAEVVEPRDDVQAPVPRDAQRIDVQGRHVYPALINAFSQLGLTEIGAVRATHDFREVGKVNLMCCSRLPSL